MPKRGERVAAAAVVALLVLSASPSFAAMSGTPSSSMMDAGMMSAGTSSMPMSGDDASNMPMSGTDMSKMTAMMEEMSKMMDLCAKMMPTTPPDGRTPGK